MRERIILRGMDSGRNDDNLETLRKRFETFRQSTKPVIDEYLEKEKVVTINAL
jgi:UMP-CMP kinase